VATIWTKWFRSRRTHEPAQAVVAVTEHPKAAEYEIITQPDFLCLRVLPGATLPAPADVHALFSRMADTARAAGVSKILVDARAITGPLGTVQQFNYVVVIVEHFRAAFKIAFVLNPSLRDPQHFGETAAVNRGVNTRTFEDMEAAYAWLEVKDPDTDLG
jgi:hypothetical protein